MKQVRASDLIPGMSTAAEVTGTDGIVKLLESSTRLTKAHIDKIREWGVQYLAIESANEKATPHDIDRTEAEFLAIYADTLNDIVDAFRHFERLKEVPILRMRELAEQRIPLLFDTVGAIGYLSKLKYYSEHTFKHLLNVAVIAGMLGKWLGYRDAALKDIILTGLLHDVGKLTVPLAILEKPGALSAEEFAVIRRHSREGYRLVNESGQLAEGIGRGILLHHERLDGSGYPYGLSGDDICPEAEIIAIADTYDAMTSDRAYRRKVTPFAAMEAIAADMFDKFNPVVAMAFLNNMRDRLIGCRVILSNGQAAKVIGFNDKYKNFANPVVYTEKAGLVDLQNGKIGIKELG